MDKNIIERATRKITSLLFNNLLINPVWIFLGKDDWINRRLVHWRNVKYDESKSLQENVGYSRHPEIEESRKKMHQLLQHAAEQYLSPGDGILDVGCGTGLFLAPLQQQYTVTGIDLNKNFLKQAKQLVPGGTFLEGNYLALKLAEPVKMIFLEGAFQYFAPGKLEALFRKFHDDLKPGGILIIHYSHALSLKDFFYHDLTYIRYRPSLVEKRAAKYFTILEHHHYIDDRKVKGYDRKHYYFPDGTNRSTQTNLNTYLLLAQRRQ